MCYLKIYIIIRYDEDNAAHNYDNCSLLTVLLTSCADKCKVFSNVYVMWISIGWIQLILDFVRKEAMWSRGCNAHSHTYNHVREGAAFGNYLSQRKTRFLRFVTFEVSFLSVFSYRKLAASVYCVDMFY